MVDVGRDVRHVWRARNRGDTLLDIALESSERLLIPEIFLRIDVEREDRRPAADITSVMAQEPRRNAR